MANLPAMVNDLFMLHLVSATSTQNELLFLCTPRAITETAATRGGHKGGVSDRKIRRLDSRC